MANTHSLSLTAASSQYAAANDSASLDITGNLTIEAWIKPTSTPSNTCTIVGKYHTASSQQAYIFYLDGNSNLIGFVNSSNGSNAVGVSVSWTPTFSTWYHVAVVYTAAGGTADFYVNGVPYGTQQSGLWTSTFNSSEKCAVGATGPNGGAGGYFDGKIDDVRIWSTNRSSAQILANYKTELTGSESNLNAYWTLNNVYTDSTANANTLTSSGSPVFSTDVPVWQLPLPVTSFYSQPIGFIEF